MERIDLVERLVGILQFLRVHDAEIVDDTVCDSFGIEIDTRRVGCDRAYPLGQKSATASDLEHAIGRARPEELADATQMAVDFDRRIQQRVLSGLVVHRHCILEEWAFEDAKKHPGIGSFLFVDPTCLTWFGTAPNVAV